MKWCWLCTRWCAHLQASRCFPWTRWCSISVCRTFASAAFAALQRCLIFKSTDLFSPSLGNWTRSRKMGRTVHKQLIKFQFAVLHLTFQLKALPNMSLLSLAFRKSNSGFLRSFGEMWTHRHTRFEFLIRFGTIYTEHQSVRVHQIKAVLGEFEQHNFFSSRINDTEL